MPTSVELGRLEKEVLDLQKVSTDISLGGRRLPWAVKEVKAEMYWTHARRWREGGGWW